MKQMIRKTVLITVLSLAFIPLNAQNRFTWSLELATGVGFDRGPLATFTPELVSQYEFGNGLNVGAGAGIRIGAPCWRYNTLNQKYDGRDFCLELDAPVFVRVGYSNKNFFANFDAGYSIGLYARHFGDWIPDAETDPIYNGLFLEPKLGWKTSRRGALALGLLLQQSCVLNHTESKTDSGYLGSDVSMVLFTPAITLRYIIHF